MQEHLSKREREAMDILFRLGKASAKQVMDNMEQAPSYSAVRALMVILEQKGLASHEHEGKTYVYRPRTDSGAAAKSALRRVVGTFFGDSSKDAIAALIQQDGERMSSQEFAELEALIKAAKERGHS
jgi:predicted transcriptional regulator